MPGSLPDHAPHSRLSDRPKQIANSGGDGKQPGVLTGDPRVPGLVAPSRHDAAEPRRRDKLFVDYAGDTAPVIVDRLTGNTFRRPPILLGDRAGGGRDVGSWPLDWG